MSAQSKDSQPSIDDILSSIREIIADDSAAGDGESSPEARASQLQDREQTVETEAQGNILTVLRGHEAANETAEGAPEAPEDVLDLSEEYIVTEAAAADERAQDQQGDVEPEPVEEVSEYDENGAEPDDHQTQAMTNGATEAWPDDYQMPVGEEGPKSPFAAAQAQSAGAWPSAEPFDAIESYKLARSLGGVDYRTRPQAAADGDENTRDVDPEALFRSSEHLSADPAEINGIELTSRSGAAPREDALSAADASTTSPEDESVEEQASDRPWAHHEGQSRSAHVAEDIEAVFGMPPRQWAAPAGQTQDDWDGQDEEAPQSAETDVPRDEAGLETTVINDGVEDISAASEDQMLDQDGSLDVSRPLPAAEAEPAQQPEPSGADAPTAAHTVSEPAFSVPASPSAKTLEDSVKELLRPMLQEWLDKNMPRLVEAAMREEVGASQTGETSEDGDQRTGHPNDDRDR